MSPASAIRAPSELKWYSDTRNQPKTYTFPAAKGENAASFALCDECGFVFGDSLRQLRLLDGDVAREFLCEVIAQAQAQGLISDEHFTVDGTLLEATPAELQSGNAGNLWIAGGGEVVTLASCPRNK